MTSKLIEKRRREEGNLIRVTLNGIGGFERRLIAADSIGGWIEVFDAYRRYPGGGEIIVVAKHPISRRLYGDVHITYRGFPMLRVGV